MQTLWTKFIKERVLWVPETFHAMPLVASGFGRSRIILRPTHFLPESHSAWFLSQTAKETTGSGDQNAADPAASRQIQNKIDLREVLWARKTEQPLQTVVFTNTAGRKTSPGSMLHCHNPASQSHRRGKNTTLVPRVSKESIEVRYQLTQKNLFAI